MSEDKTSGLQNPLENQPPSDENDFLDAVKGFGISVGFFMTVFLIAIIVEVYINFFR